MAFEAVNSYTTTMDYCYVPAEQKNDKLPILILHGWGGDKDSFAFLKPYFSDRDLWFISFYGHGSSPQPKEPMNVLDFATEIIAFMHKHGLKKVDIVAHSFGGRVALVLLSTYPHLFGKVALTGCAGLKPKRGIKLHAKILFFKLKKWLVKLKLASPKVLQNAGSEDYRTLSPVMRETFKKVVNQDLKKYAKQIKHETLLIWGEKDTATPLFMGKKLNKYIKDSTLIELKDRTHFCFYEEPSRFALILQHFFVY